MVQPGARQHLEAASLTSGRSLFVSRCARCHALPEINDYSAEKWPHIVAEMAKRSGLQGEQRNVVLAYIRAARAQ